MGVLMIAVAAAGLLVGAALLVVGLRGRRIDDHPLCRGCRFDLVGVYPGAAVCPECGRSLTAERAVVCGRRVRRRGMTRAGAALLGLVLGLTGTVIAVAASGWSVYRSLPNSWLSAMIKPEGASTAPRAMQELVQRLQDSTLDRATIDSLVETALTRQGDPSVSWSPQWGNLVQEARAAGHLSEEQWTRYLRQAISGPTLVYRKRIRTGELAWPVGFGARARVGEPGRTTQGLPHLRATLVAAEIGDTRVGVGPGHMSLVYLQHMFMDLTTIASASLPVPVPPGRYNARLTWQVEIPPAHAGGAAVSWPLTFECPLEVVPAGTQLVALVADESMRGRIEPMVEIANFRVTNHAGRLFSDGAVRLEGRPPMPLSFDVFIRAGGEGGREWHVATLAMNARDGGTATGMFNHLDGLDPAATTVDVVLRPNAEAAVREPLIDRIWDGELILRDLPVGGGAESQQPADTGR